MYSLNILFGVFLFYSLFGWCMEVVVTFISTRKLVNRGYLIGPVCPIYGIGGTLILILLKKYHNDYIALFFAIIILGAILEYFTSWLMEKLFKARWWDYSNKLFNIDGRVCLQNLVAFGVLGVLATKYSTPFIINILSKMNPVLLNTLCIIFFIILLVDICISTKVISGFKHMAVNVRKDSTEEITKKVKEMLTKRGGLYKRIPKAFNIKASENLIKYVKNKAKEVKDKAIKVKEETKEMVSKKKEQVKDTANKVKENTKKKINKKSS